MTFSLSLRHTMCAAMILTGFAIPASVSAAEVQPASEPAPVAPLMAQEPQTAAAFVDDLAQRALSVLRDKTSGKEKIAATFKDMLQNGFDLSMIGRFALGRFWHISTPEQQKEYLDLFERMVIQIYTDRFSLYSGEGFKIVGSRAESERDWVVTAQIMPTDGSPAVTVDWRLRLRPQGWRVIDVMVEGISMSVTQRAEFASIIQRGSGDVESLLQVLRQRTQEVTPASPANNTADSPAAKIMPLVSPHAGEKPVNKANRG